MKSAIKHFVLIFLLLFSSRLFSAEIKWARAKFEVTAGSEDLWDCESDRDLVFLNFLNRITTIKVEEKVNIASLTDLNEMIKYPVLFMHASGELILEEKEKENIREFLKRGGFIFAEDCLNTELDYRFYNSFKELIEKSVYKDRKFEVLKNDHDIYKILYQFSDGVPWYREKVPIEALYDNSGRIIILLSRVDMQCCWGAKRADRKKLQEETWKMGANIIIYALSH